MLNKNVIFVSRLYLREMPKTIINQHTDGSVEISIFFQDVVSVVHLGINVFFYHFEDNHNFVVKKRKHRLLVLFFAFLIFFSNTLVNAGKLGITVVFFQKSVVTFLNILKTFYNIVESLGFFVEFGYRVNNKTVFLESLPKRLTERNKFGVVLIEIACKRRNCTLPFFFEFYAARYQTHFFRTNFAEIKFDVHHSIVDYHFCIIANDKRLFLIDDVFREFRLNDVTITILGAGGAARAIAVECALAGAKRIRIVNRNEERGRSLAALLNEKTPADADYLLWEGKADIPADTQILINATPVGLGTAACPEVRMEKITGDMIVCDAVFNPAKTAFLKKAEACGAKIITGLGMLVNQGALNFELWTGREAPYDLMYDVLKAEFERC